MPALESLKKEIASMKIPYAIDYTIQTVKLNPKKATAIALTALAAAAAVAALASTAALPVSLTALVSAVLITGAGMAIYNSAINMQKPLLQEKKEETSAATKEQNEQLQRKEIEYNESCKVTKEFCHRHDNDPWFSTPKNKRPYRLRNPKKSILLASNLIK